MASVFRKCLSGRWGPICAYVEGINFQSVRQKLRLGQGVVRKMFQELPKYRYVLDSLTEPSSSLLFVSRLGDGDSKGRQGNLFRIEVALSESVLCGSCNSLSEAATVGAVPHGLGQQHSVHWVSRVVVGDRLSNHRGCPNVHGRVRTVRAAFTTCHKYLRSGTGVVVTSSCKATYLKARRQEECNVAMSYSSQVPCPNPSSPLDRSSTRAPPWRRSRIVRSVGSSWPAGPVRCAE